MRDLNKTKWSAFRDIILIDFERILQMFRSTIVKITSCVYYSKTIVLFNVAE